MKKLIVLVAIIATGIVGYNYLYDTADVSAEERTLQDLEDRFETASRSAVQAERSAGIGGLDTTASIRAARATVRGVESSLEQLEGRLESDQARDRAERLKSRIREFRNRYD